jgi:hypothetical protein
VIQIVGIMKLLKRLSLTQILAKKQGDLSCLRVYKLKIHGQLILIGYYVDNETLTFAALGPHENFYRDIKK